MKMKKMHWIGMGFGLFVMIVGGALFFRDINLLIFLVGIGIAVIALPFVVDIVLANKKKDDVDKMFLEFSRNLSESVNAGTPISRSIINMRNKNYGVLTPNIQKLSNQIELGIPVDKALRNFAYDLDSSIIKRAVALIRQAEKAGGEIEFILDSVAKSIAEVDKITKERKAAVSSLTVQGYIIFFIFIGIVVIMQFKILPLLGDIDYVGSTSDLGGFQDSAELNSGSAVDIESIGRSFLYLLLAQGLFTGLAVGKLSEGSIKSGVKHSFILMITAFLVSSGANLLMG